MESVPSFHTPHSTLVLGVVLVIPDAVPYPQNPPSSHRSPAVFCIPATFCCGGACRLVPPTPRGLAPTCALNFKLEVSNSYSPLPSPPRPIPQVQSPAVAEQRGAHPFPPRHRGLPRAAGGAGRQHGGRVPGGCARRLGGGGQVFSSIGKVLCFYDTTLPDRNPSSLVSWI